MLDQLNISMILELTIDQQSRVMSFIISVKNKCTYRKLILLVDGPTNHQVSSERNLFAHCFEI